MWSVILIKKIYSDSKHHHKVQSPCRKKPKNGALYEQSASRNLPCVKAGHVYTFPPCVNNTIWTESYVQHKCQLEGNSLNTKQEVYTTKKFHNVSFCEIPHFTHYTLLQSQCYKMYWFRVTHIKHTEELLKVYKMWKAECGGNTETFLCIQVSPLPSCIHLKQHVRHGNYIYCLH